MNIGEKSKKNNGQEWKILNGIAKIGSTQFTMGMEAACELWMEEEIAFGVRTFMKTLLFDFLVYSGPSTGEFEFIAYFR